MLASEKSILMTWQAVFWFLAEPLRLVLVLLRRPGLPLPLLPTHPRTVHQTAPCAGHRSRLWLGAAAAQSARPASSITVNRASETSGCRGRGRGPTLSSSTPPTPLYIIAFPQTKLNFISCT